MGWTGFERKTCPFTMKAVDLQMARLYEELTRGRRQGGEAGDLLDALAGATLEKGWVASKECDSTLLSLSAAPSCWPSVGAAPSRNAPTSAPFAIASGPVHPVGSGHAPPAGTGVISAVGNAIGDQIGALVRIATQRLRNPTKQSGTPG